MTEAHGVSVPTQDEVQALLRQAEQGDRVAVARELRLRQPVSPEVPPQAVGRQSRQEAARWARAVIPRVPGHEPASALEAASRAYALAFVYWLASPFAQSRCELWIRR